MQVSMNSIRKDSPLVITEQFDTETFPISTGGYETEVKPKKKNLLDVAIEVLDSSHLKKDQDYHDEN